MTAYYLRKWSIYIRIRDNHTCYMCEENYLKQSSTVTRRSMHAHHIDMKSIYPTKALSLNNGVCLCSRCHLEVVHTNNPKSPKKFRALFLRWVRRKANREFNAKWQHKLDLT